MKIVSNVPNPWPDGVNNGLLQHSPLGVHAITPIVAILLWLPTAPLETAKTLRASPHLVAWEEH